MPTLNIVDFSCIREASFQLAPVTVIIGPQGSGKSITTKLFYFCADTLSSFVQSAERGDSVEDYKKLIAKQFVLWFPAAAWGNGRFNITYNAGSFSVRILRRQKHGKLSDEVSVTFSEWFMESYASALELFEKSKSVDDVDVPDSNAQFSFSIEKVFRTRVAISQRLSNSLGNQYVSSQTFIPAGRAFFTSIGRLVAGFEQAGSLDPVTIKFARLLASIRDRNTRHVLTISRRSGADADAKRLAFMNKLFGGEIKFEEDAEFVETSDGRRVPFTSLSSGQQELLPMWSLMDYLNENDLARERHLSRLGERRAQSRELIYIEEPEAHLFPSAQSLLMEFLIGSIASERSQRSLIITTHSPYIMGKLNVFLKAGQMARRRKRNSDIGEVVPRECWLSESQLSAYAIKDRRLMDIIDDDGIIDGRYLDEISEDLSREFSKLLQIESEMSEAKG